MSEHGSIAEAEPRTSVIAGLSDTGHIVLTGGPLPSLLGRTDGTVHGLLLSEAIPAHPPWEPDLAAAATGQVVTSRRTWVDADGRVIHADTAVLPAHGPSPVAALVHLTAVTPGVGGAIGAHAASQRALANSQQRFRTALHSAPIGMAVTAADGAFLEVNPALMDMLERDEQWLAQHDVESVTHPSDLAEVQRMRAELRAPGGPDRVRGEHRLLSARGRPIWVQHSSALMPLGDGPATFVCQFVDITETRRARGLLQYLADHDPLTNVMNRRGLLELMDTDDGRVARRPALLYCDLDGFKPINDRLGHDVGDRLLIEVAGRIERSLRGDDTVGRIGGDEFVVLLRGMATVDDARAVAEKIRSAVAEPYLVGDESIRITVSVGLALGANDEHPEVTLRRADKALYRAKAAGGNSVAAYDAQRDEPNP